MKLKDSDRYVNKNVGDNLTKGRTLSSQVREIIIFLIDIEIAVILCQINLLYRYISYNRK